MRAACLNQNNKMIGCKSLNELKDAKHGSSYCLVNLNVLSFSILFMVMVLWLGRVNGNHGFVTMGEIFQITYLILELI